LKKLEGNAGKRPLPQDEPQPAAAQGVPACPAYLKKAARKEWHNIAGKLHAVGLLTEVDHAALEVYCSYYQQWVEADRELARLEREHRDALKRRRKDPRSKEPLPSNGMVAVTSNGNAIMEPMLSVKKQAAEMMLKCAAEFGMSPATRARLSGEGVSGKKKSMTPMEELLSSTRAMVN